MISKEPPMPMSSLAFQSSPHDLRAELATPPTCPMVVVTDIDGTLRDPRTQSVAPADLALSTLAAHGVPVVLVGTGPAAPIVDLQHDLGIVQPFICGEHYDIHIPTGYFAHSSLPRLTTNTWEVIEMGPCESQSRAIRLLRSLYRSWNDRVMLIGLGDDWSDRFLLLEVDVPIIVRNDELDQAPLIARVPQAFLTRDAGPAGWAEAILGSTIPECP
jgi:predicted mannosyl-3-phosphoglycerate phosphatase (HAD superfamily)